MSQPLTLSEIWVYPIKSLGGISMQAAVTETRGLQYDRRWMLVDVAGRFVSQREIPAMAMLGTTIGASFLTVFWKHKPTERIDIPLDIPISNLPSLLVEVWDDQCTACSLPEEINQWFSAQLGQDLRLVLMPETTHRSTDERYTPPGHPVSFADGFPYMIIGQASLDELNTRLDHALPINRFRPNLVFTGGQAFEEDTWEAFWVGKQPFKGVKLCARCIMPTIDQDTAARAAEPLKTLAGYRNTDNKIFFGQNVIWLGEGSSFIRVGDRISQPAK